MSYSKIHTYIREGVTGTHVDIQTTKNKSLPCIEIIGLADMAVRESKERIRAALGVIGIRLPPNKIIINISPSSVKKRGTSLDLPLFLSVYMLSISSKTIPGFNIEKTLFFGELSLSGEIKEIGGILPLVLSAISDGWSKFVVPLGDSKQLENIPGIEVWGVSHISDVITGKSKSIEQKEYLGGKEEKEAFLHIYGHEKIKRALRIAVVGSHNILLLGSPGSGKSALAKEVKNLLGSMSFEESLETTGIHSISGILPSESGLLRERPFFSVHHSITSAGLIGGGRPVSCGVISKCHNGVLMMDEVFEFPAKTINLLREPMEDRKVTISRIGGSIEFPCKFILVATGNPCPCGYYGSQEHICTCSELQVKNYQKKVQGPFLDRIDMIVSVFPEKSTTVIKKDGKSGTSGKRNNMCLQAVGEEDTLQYFSPASLDFLTESSDTLGLSTRSLLKTSRLAYTISRFDGAQQVEIIHVAEALSYRVNGLMVA